MNIDINTGCLLLMGLALLAGIAHRIKTNKGIGLRFCQYLAITMGLPAILMLAFADKVDKDTLATLVGTVVGFLASGVGKDET